jgi:TM2 domain-containing membrane protein YozV
MTKRKVNWVLVLILSVFFGAFGVDRFVLGKVGTGILKLLITIFTFGLLGWIWWIVDIILIATKYEFEGIEWVNE